MGGLVCYCVGTVYIAPSANTYRARIGTVVRNGDASHTIRQFSLLLGRGVAVALGLALGLGAGGAVGGARHVTTKLCLRSRRSSSVRTAGFVLTGGGGGVLAPLVDKPMPFISCFNSAAKRFLLIFLHRHDRGIMLTVDL